MLSETHPLRAFLKKHGRPRNPYTRLWEAFLHCFDLNSHGNIFNFLSTHVRKTPLAKITLPQDYLTSVVFEDLIRKTIHANNSAENLKALLPVLLQFDPSHCRIPKELHAKLLLSLQNTTYPDNVLRFLVSYGFSTNIHSTDSIASSLVANENNTPALFPLYAAQFWLERKKKEQQEQERAMWLREKTTQVKVETARRIVLPEYYANYANYARQRREDSDTTILPSPKLPLAPPRRTRTKYTPISSPRDDEITVAKEPDRKNSVGKGNFATVRATEGIRYRAGSQPIRCAVKETHAEAYDQISDLLKREVTVLRLLKHPNIVRSFRDTNNPSAFIMPFFTGTLDELLRDPEKYPLSTHDQVAIASQLLDALRYLEANGVAHCDIKPENILFEPSPTGECSVALADFGLARTMRNSIHRNRIPKLPTAWENCYGDFAWVSREQWRGENPINHQDDVYSLGLTLFYLFTGKAINYNLCFPFAENKERALKAVQAKEPNYRRKVYQEKNIAHNIQTLIESCLNDSYKQRPTPRELFDTFTQHLSVADKLLNGTNRRIMREQYNPNDSTALSITCAQLNCFEGFFNTEQPSGSLQHDLKTFLTEKIPYYFLVGPPGSGKTAHIINFLQQKRNTAGLLQTNDISYLPIVIEFSQMECNQSLDRVIMARLRKHYHLSKQEIDGILAKKGEGLLFIIDGVTQQLPALTLFNKAKCIVTSTQSEPIATTSYKRHIIQNLKLKQIMDYLADRITLTSDNDMNLQRWCDFIKELPNTALLTELRDPALLILFPKLFATSSPEENFKTLKKYLNYSKQELYAVIINKLLQRMLAILEQDIYFKTYPQVYTKFLAYLLPQDGIEKNGTIEDNLQESLVLSSALRRAKFLNESENPWGDYSLQRFAREAHAKHATTTKHGKKGKYYPPNTEQMHYLKGHLPRVLRSVHKILPIVHQQQNDLNMRLLNYMWVKTLINALQNQDIDLIEQLLINLTLENESILLEEFKEQWQKLAEKPKIPLNDLHVAIKIKLHFLFPTTLSCPMETSEISASDYDHNRGIPSRKISTSISNSGSSCFMDPMDIDSDSEESGNEKNDIAQVNNAPTQGIASPTVLSPAYSSDNSPFSSQHDLLVGSPDSGPESYAPNKAPAFFKLSPPASPSGSPEKRTRTCSFQKITAPAHPSMVTTLIRQYESYSRDSVSP